MQPILYVHYSLPKLIFHFCLLDLLDSSLDNKSVCYFLSPTESCSFHASSPALGAPLETC